MRKGYVVALVDEQHPLLYNGQEAAGRCCRSQRPPLDCILVNIGISVAVYCPLNNNHLDKGHVKTCNIAIWYIGQVTCRGFQVTFISSLLSSELRKVLRSSHNQVVLLNVLMFQRNFCFNISMTKSTQYSYFSDILWCPIHVSNYGRRPFPTFCYKSLLAAKGVFTNKSGWGTFLNFAPFEILSFR